MYQIDLTETEWQYITKVLNLQERKRKFDLRIVWNAIFYLVKTGCQWRMLPKEQGFRAIKKRWIVERTFSWLDWNRRLCRNYELTFDSAEVMIKLATIRLLLRKI